MPIYRLNNSGVWKKLGEAYRLNQNGIWKSLGSMYRLNQNGIWKKVFSRITAPVIEQQVEISRSGQYHNSTNIITLTGTKYHFSNATTFEYRFFSSPDGSNWTGMGDDWITTTNPSSGSSSTVTRQLTNSDFTTTLMYFQFRYRATNSNNVTTVSASSAITVTFLDIPAPPPGFPNINQSTITVPSIASSGTWIGSPTQYDWIWQYGPSNTTLTFQANKSISTVALSGTTATVTSFSHGFKTGDSVSFSGINDLFNQSFTNISSVFTNFFSYTVSKPAWSFSSQYSINNLVNYNSQIYRALLATPSRSTWSFTTNYTTGQHVNYGSPASVVYRATANIPSPRTSWNSTTSYTAGQYVNYNSQVYQATGPSLNITPDNPDFWQIIDIYPGGSGGYWTLIDIYPTSTTYWQLQNGASASGGTATGPNYYEGSSSSPISYTIASFPSTDYKTGTSLKGLTTRLNFTVYNVAFTGFANSTPRTIYGYPVINIGTITTTSSTASIPYTQTDMDKYDIDLKRSLAVTSAVVSGSNIVYTTLRPHQLSSSSTISVSGMSPASFNASGVFIVSSTQNTFTIENNSGAIGSSTSGGTVVGSLSGYPKYEQANTSPISLTSLPSDSSYTVYLTPKNADSPRVSGIEKNSSFTTPPTTGLTPIFGATTRTSSGFTGSITNYDSNYSWSISTTAGSVSWGTVSGSNYPFTVTGLNPGQSATVTVTTSRLGFETVSASITESAQLGPARTPTFGPNTSLSNGFSGSVTNYDSNWSWFVSTSAGTVTPEILSGTGSTQSFTVSGLTQGQSATVTVTTVRSGYNNGSASTTGSAVSAGLTPTFGANTSSSNGFTGSVTNYNALFNWNISSSAGTVTWGTPSGSNYPFTVFNLNPGQSATVTVTTSRTGFNNASASTTGSALNGAARNPTFGTNTSVSGGFTGSVTNYDSNWNWFVSTSAGTVNPDILSGVSSTQSFSVSGLSAGQSATVTVTTTRTGFNTGSGSTTGTASLGAARNPTFGTNTRTNGGFTGSVTNYDAAWSWSISSSSGSVSWGTPSGSTYPFTVSGLSAGQSATVTVTTTRTGFNNGSGTTTESALSAGLVPTFGANSGTSNGFTGFVNNYDLTYTWNISVSSGSVSWGTPSGSSYPFTVTGLSAGASATVTVTTSRTGSLNGVGTTTGTATPAAQVPGQVINGVATRYTATLCNKTDISWSAPTSGGTVETYEIFVTTSSTVTPTSATAANLVSNIPASQTGYTRSSFSTLAYYFVRARNAAGPGAYSARITPTLNTGNLC